MKSANRGPDEARQNPGAAVPSGPQQWNDPRIAQGMRRQSELRARRLDAGARLIGWKVGFGAPAAKERLKIESPLVGFLLDQAVLSSGATVSLRGWQKPVAEPEIAIHLGRDVAPDAPAAAARAAIAALAPAIEIADVDCPMDDVEAILAGDIFQRHVVLGSRNRSHRDAGGLSGRVRRSDTVLDVPADLQANTGDLVDIVRHVAATAALCADGLRAGQVIIAGSVTPPLFVAPGENVTFELVPIGAVSVAFAG
jgi:2-keto-4-pentenoate hydratase